MLPIEHWVLATFGRKAGVDVVGTDGAAAAEDCFYFYRTVLFVANAALVSGIANAVRRGRIRVFFFHMGPHDYAMDVRLVERLDIPRSDCLSGLDIGNI